LSILITNKKQTMKKIEEPIGFGVTRDAVLFMDLESKEIKRQVLLKHIKRYASSPSTFTLDLGDHDDGMI